MAETIQIDIWGHIKGESDQYRVKPPYEVETDAPAVGNGYIYHRFFNECPCAIHRDGLSESNGRVSIVTMVAYGDWNDKENLNYSSIDSPFLSVYRQEVFAEDQTVNATVGTAFTFEIPSSLRYGTDLTTIKSYVPTYSAQLPDGVTLSGTTISGTNEVAAGTYTVTVCLIAPLSKELPITVTLVVS